MLRHLAAPQPVRMRQRCRRLLPLVLCYYMVPPSPIPPAPPATSALTTTAERKLLLVMLPDYDQFSDVQSTCSESAQSEAAGDRCASDGAMTKGTTHQLPVLKSDTLLVVPFVIYIFKILQGSPQKELQWSLWLGRHSEP